MSWIASADMEDYDGLDMLHRGTITVLSETVEHPSCVFFCLPWCGSGDHNESHDTSGPYDETVHTSGPWTSRTLLYRPGTKEQAQR